MKVWKINQAKRKREYHPPSLAVLTNIHEWIQYITVVYHITYIYSQATHKILVCIVTFSAHTVLLYWDGESTKCAVSFTEGKLCVNSIIKVLIIPLSVQVKYVEWLVENFQNKYCKNLIKWSVICNTLGITSLLLYFMEGPKLFSLKQSGIG